MANINIVWFRRDLRLDDNQSVSDACQNGHPTLFVFCLDPWFFYQKEIGWARVHFLFESLIALDIELKKLGSKLIILEGKTEKTLSTLAQNILNSGVQPNLYYNHDVQVQYGKDRDIFINNWFREKNLDIHTGLANYLLFDEKDMPQWRKNYYEYLRKDVYLAPELTIHTNNPQIFSELIITEPNTLLQRFTNTYTTPKSRLFTGGSTEAKRVLESFLETRVNGYHWRLSRPYLSQTGATSQLGPHLAFGTISVRTVYQAAKHAEYLAKAQGNPKKAFSINSFLDRLRWKDSFTQRLLFRLELMWKNRFAAFDEHYSDSPLSGQKLEYFESWKKGTTGFAMIDASMRQLNTDGYMNFRMRAMNATFLTINCGISWHHGARYFMQRLVDGDVAINHWQWQMQAGITNPLSPVFRIYSPDKNLVEKDPDLEYVHYWCPELRQYMTHVEIIKNSKPMLDFVATKKVNGTIISHLRKTVREQVQKNITSSKNTEHIATATAVKIYRQTRNRKYKEMRTAVSKTKTDHIFLHEGKK